MRRVGWILTGLMLLYPVDAILSERATRQLLAAERAAQQARPPTSGMQFDLRTSGIHCGPLGWAGAWAFLLGVVWALVANGLWLHYRLDGRSLATSSRYALVVVVAGVAVVLVALMAQYYS
jgi:hypothetical protein